MDSRNSASGTPMCRQPGQRGSTSGGGAVRRIEFKSSRLLDDGERQWYVVLSKQHQELLVQAALREKGIETYVPRIRQWPRPAVGSPVAPLFPGYVFARMRVPADYRTVCWTVGVKRLLSFGEQLAVLPEGAVALLKSREDEQGLVRIGDPADCTPNVKIVRGPFEGFTAVVEKRLRASERVVVLIDFLQRQTRMELPERWLRLA
ncbi:MAG: hypothetical protein D6815_03775 [Candidatus Dadabacteria bacterium]|nr:MAG: hypothetical protein D6815_03775 [Candidatus Dadabacteria bacterium]